MQQNEAAIINEVLAGNTQAYAELVDTYKDYAFTIALRVIKNKEEAEEISQDAFIKAYQKLSTFKQTSRFSTWLYSIVYRAAISHTRKKGLDTKELKEERTYKQAIEKHTHFSKLTDNETKEYVQQCINHLPADEATVITLFYLQESSVNEVAEITGLSESNVKVKAHRARKKLKVLLQSVLQNELNDMLAE